jgi:hypothetical protein
MKKLLFFAVLITGCSAKYTLTDESVAVKRDTRNMLQSKVARMAGLKTDGLTYYFIFNQNNSFSAIVDMDDSKKYDFCAGTFEYNSDTLSLSYYNNFKSKYITDKAIIDTNSNELVLINPDYTVNKRIKFLDQL